MTRATALAVLGAIAAGCSAMVASPGTRGGPPQTDPCEGTELSLGEAALHCRDDDDVDDPPSPEAVEVLIRTRELRSGIDGVVEVVFRNRAGRELELSFPGTLDFDASIWQGDHRVDERWEVSALVGGVTTCPQGTDCRPVHVELGPDGTLVASIEVSTRVVVVRDAATVQHEGEVSHLERADGGPIPPGEYELRVTVPWRDRVEGSTTDAHTARVVRGPLTITP
jgi:hypothetical protein